ncbi:MAG: YhbY family RNA-binding protein [Nanoarchaeota archaeon]|nr:YhbY family RNA-binding protein [Nanoarchaeota archaeon]
MKKLQIGKNGLSVAFIDQIKKMFVDAEIMKITILKSACRNKKEAVKICDELMKSLGPKYAYKLIGYVVSVRKFRKVQR